MIKGRKVFRYYVHTSRVEADKRRAVKQDREQAKQLQNLLECSQVVIDHLVEDINYKSVAACK